MNDLGLTLAWLAVQVSLVLVPALALSALASRRSPSAGAWVASLSLSLVVALNAAAFLPGIGSGRRVAENDRNRRAAAVRPMPRLPAPSAMMARAARMSATGRSRTCESPGPGSSAGRPSRRRGSGPGEERWRSLPSPGSASGLLRLALGLGAVVACRRRGRLVDDPMLVGLLDELRGAIGCRLPVELREVPDLVGPATAGWRQAGHPAAGRLALVGRARAPRGARARAGARRPGRLRGRPDCPAGRGLERLSPAGPLDRGAASGCSRSWRPTRWAHEHAGGRAGYLVALSRLALRQDGRSPCWPARAFLPARGTLIRRISMLREETRTGMVDRPWSRARRISAVRVSPRRDGRGGDAPRPGPGLRGRRPRPEGRDRRRRPFVAAAVFRRRLGRRDRIPSRGGRPPRRLGPDPGPLSDLQNAGP